MTFTRTGDRGRLNGPGSGQIGAAVGTKPGYRPAARLLGREGEAQVVAPVASDVEIPLEQAFLAESELVSTRRLAAFSGRTVASTRCRPATAKQWSTTSATAAVATPPPRPDRRPPSSRPTPSTAIRG